MDRLVAVPGIHWQINPRTRGADLCLPVGDQRQTRKQLIYELVAVQYAWHQLIHSQRTGTADWRIDLNLPIGNQRRTKKHLIYELVVAVFAWHQLIKSHRTITADSRIDWNLPLGNQRWKSWFTIWLQFAWHQLIKSQRTRTADWRTGCSLHGLLPFQGGDMVQSIGGETCYNGKLKNKKWNYK